jgi:transcriptional regulator with XRE-family HTH domain
VARRRRFSEEPFGPTIERLMGETGVTYRALADKTKLSAGYLNHLVHGNRPVPSDKVVRQLAKAPDVEPGHFREYRLRAHAQARGHARLDRPALQAPGLISGDELDVCARIAEAPDPQVGLDLHPRPRLVGPRRNRGGALAAVVAARRAQPEEHELDLFPAAVAATVLQPASRCLGIDGVADPDADQRRTEMADLALAAAQEGDQFWRHRRVVEFQAHHVVPYGKSDAPIGGRPPAKGQDGPGARRA